MSALVSMSCFLLAGLLLGVAIRMELNRRRALAEPGGESAPAAEPSAPPSAVSFKRHSLTPSRPASSSADVSLDRAADASRPDKRESGMPGPPPSSEFSPALSPADFRLPAAPRPPRSHVQIVRRDQKSPENHSSQGLSRAPEPAQNARRPPERDDEEPRREDDPPPPGTRTPTTHVVRKIPLPARAEPERTRSPQPAVVTIAVEPHVRLEQQGTGSRPVHDVTLYKFSRVLIGNDNKAERTIKYRIRAVKFDADELTEKLRGGAARKALIRLIGDPDDRRANDRFRRELTKSREPDDLHRHMVSFRVTQHVDVTAIGCDVVAFGDRNTAPTKSSHMIARGRIPVSTLLGGDPELVATFARLLRDPSNREIAQQFNRRIGDATRDLAPEELVRTLNCDGAPTRVVRFGDGLSACGDSAATGTVGRDNRIVQKIRTEVGKIPEPAKEVARSTRKVSGMTRDISRMHGPFEGPGR